jgi:hypothetical protein
LLAYIYGGFGIFEFMREKGIKKIRAEFEKRLAGTKQRKK